MGQPKFSQVGQTAASFVLIQVRSRCLDEHPFHLNRQDNSDGLLWSWRTIPAFWIFIESISPSLLPTSQSHLLIPQPNPTPSPPTNPTHNHGLHPPLQTQRHRSLQTHCTLSHFPTNIPQLTPLHKCIATLPPTLLNAPDSVRSLAPYLWTLPFTTLSPETCLVLDDVRPAPPPPHHPHPHQKLTPLRATA